MVVDAVMMVAGRTVVHRPSVPSWANGYSGQEVGATTTSHGRLRVHRPYADDDGHSTARVGEDKLSGVGKRWMPQVGGKCLAPS